MRCPSHDDSAIAGVHVRSAQFRPCRLFDFYNGWSVVAEGGEIDRHRQPGAGIVEFQHGDIAHFA